MGPVSISLDDRCRPRAWIFLQNVPTRLDRLFFSTAVNEDRCQVYATFESSSRVENSRVELE